MFKIFSFIYVEKICELLFCKISMTKFKQLESVSAQQIPNTTFRLFVSQIFSGFQPKSAARCNICKTNSLKIVLGYLLCGYRLQLFENFHRYLTEQ